jgi:hypothetical protein
MDLAETFAKVLESAHSLNLVVRSRRLGRGRRALGRHL